MSDKTSFSVLVVEVDEAGLDAKAIPAVDGLSVLELDSGESVPDEHRPCENTAIGGIPLEELGAIYIEEILQLTRGNKLKAARILGLDRATLERCKR